MPFLKGKIMMHDVRRPSSLCNKGFGIIRKWIKLCKFSPCVAQIDPRHRYGHNLHLYYDVWFDTGSSQPFFYW